jgi:hypothetical protein
MDAGFNGLRSSRQFLRRISDEREVRPRKRLSLLKTVGRKTRNPETKTW